MISESCFSSQCPLLFESTFANNLVSSAVNRDGVRGDCGEGVAIRSKCQFRVCHPQDKKNFGWLRTQIMSTFVRWKEICRTLTSLGFWFFSISKKKNCSAKEAKARFAHQTFWWKDWKSISCCPVRNKMQSNASPKQFKKPRSTWQRNAKA